MVVFGKMERKIQSIDAASVARICSGQVIVDLASVVKELVENALVMRGFEAVAACALLPAWRNIVGECSNVVLLTSNDRAMLAFCCGAGCTCHLGGNPAKEPRRGVDRSHRQRYGVCVSWVDATALSHLREDPCAGDGISPDNYEGIAMKYHTSKLERFDDLTSVNTFGFRYGVVVCSGILSFVLASSCYGD